MRLWSLHPQYLDRQALVAGWREALLAKAVIAGLTKGYRQHPQLLRFQQHPSPKYAINGYLKFLHAEAVRRGYSFDRSKIGPTRSVEVIPVTQGQVDYEWQHLLNKVEIRSPEWQINLAGVNSPDVHPLFELIPGPIAEWERHRT